MIANRTQARDETFALVKAATDNLGHPIIWQDDLSEKDVTETLFLVHMQHLEGRQAGITQGLGRIKRNITGVVTVEIRVPVKIGGLTDSDNFATLIENVFNGQATPGGVWFRDVIGREVPPKDGNARTVVSAGFTYQETKQ